MIEGSAFLIGLLFLITVVLAFWVGRLTAFRSMRPPAPEFQADAPLPAPHEPAGRPAPRGPRPAADAGPAGDGGTAPARERAAPRGKPPPAMAG